MIEAKSHKQVTGPGVYVGLSFEEYLKVPAVNHSTLRHAAASMAHFRHQELHPEDNETPSKRLGTATHTLLLEPARFTNIIPPPINPKTGNPFGSGTKAWDEYAEANPGKTIMSDEEVELAKGMVAAVKAHRRAAELLYGNGRGLSEVVMVWNEGEILCKGRVDRIGTDCRVDLKTTGDLAKWDVWRGSAVKYNYWTQEAFYRRGAAALGLPTRGVFVVVESKPIHGVGAFKLMDEWVNTGDKEVCDWLNKLTMARATGEYPAYPDEDVETVPPPQWFISQFMDGEM